MAPEARGRTPPGAPESQPLGLRVTPKCFVDSRVEILLMVTNSQASTWRDWVKLMCERKVVVGLTIIKLEDHVQERLPLGRGGLRVMAG